MRFAYADPPYVGQSAKHYKDHPDYAGEVDHGELIGRLVADYPDGWALSLSSPSTHIVLDHCRDHGLSLMDGDLRLMPWVKPFASFKPFVNPAYCWEPVLFCGGRPFTRDQPTIRDYCSANITLRKGLTGVKPEAVCHWLFRVLNARAGDELDDLFPGSGAVSRAWDSFTRQLTLEAA